MISLYGKYFIIDKISSSEDQAPQVNDMVTGMFLVLPLSFLNFVPYHNTCVGKIKLFKERKWVTFYCIALVVVYPFLQCQCRANNAIFLSVFLVFFFSFSFLTKFISLVTFVVEK